MLAKGPNLLNLANYTQGQGEEYHYDPNQLQEVIEQNSVGLQEQFDNFIKDAQRCDEILAKVAKSIDQISAQQYFITDFYPEFAVACTYQLDHQKKIIADTDIEMAKVLENLERSNRNLKEQFKGWLFQYAKKTRLSQVLMTENKLLRKYVSNKNKDIVKLIQTINNAQNEQINELNQTLNELKQENGVLLDHLKAIKQTLHQKQDEQKKIVDAYQKAQKQKLQIQSKIQKGDDEEEHYSKMVSLLQASIQDAGRRQKKLVQEKQRLLKIKKQYESDQTDIQKQIDNCQLDREDINKHLKTKFKGHQGEKQQLIQEVEELTQKIQKVKQQSKTNEEQIVRLQYRNEQYKNICADLDKKTSEIQLAIKSLNQEAEKLKQTQVNQLSSMDMINFDIDYLKEQLKQLQEQEDRNRDKFKKQLKDLENSKKQQIAKWTQQYSKVQWKASKSVLQEKANIALKKKQIEQWQNKIAQKRNEIKDLKQQMQQIKENQAVAANLRQKIRQAEKDR